MKKIIVFDLDGTLANNQHRNHHLLDKKKNWKQFFALIHNDLVFEDIKWVAKTFSESSDIIICSARPEETRAESEQWLTRQGIKFQKLYLRPMNDRRDDTIIKIEMLGIIRSEWGEPFLWFDDRNKVVKVLRENGVRVLQVNDGNF